MSKIGTRTGTVKNSYGSTTLCAGGREGQQDEQPAAAGRDQAHGPEAEAAALEHGAREHQSYSKGTPINTNVQGFLSPRFEAGSERDPDPE